MLDINHPYAITVRKEKDTSGTYYIATIPQLGTGSFNAMGDSVEEVINNLNEVYKDVRDLLEEDGLWNNPEPLEEWEIGDRINPCIPYSPITNNFEKPVSSYEMVIYLKECLSVIDTFVSSKYFPNIFDGDTSKDISKAYHFRVILKRLLDRINECQEPSTKYYEDKE